MHTIKYSPSNTTINNISTPVYFLRVWFFSLVTQVIIGRIMKQEKIKLYVNKNTIMPKLSYTALLFPFLGIILNKNIPYANKTWKYGFNHQYFKLIFSVSEADYILMPHEYWKLKKKNPNIISAIISEAKTHGKPILVDASYDVAGKVKVPNARILRINQYRFNLPKDEITVPVPCEDLFESYCGGELLLREKKEIPIIGFVGWGKLSFKQRMRTIARELPVRIFSIFNKKYKTYRKGVFWRERAIKVFNISKKVQTNFIIRSSYSGHINTLIGDPEKNRREFVENILNSDYTLIVRGDANAATRFYETLSLGRIPVFIDTACVLPLEDKIDYKEFCVFIDYTDIDKAPDILADFHRNIAPEQFIAMQKKARYIFRHYLRYDAFSKHLVELLKKEAGDIFQKKNF